MCWLAARHSRLYRCLSRTSLISMRLSTFCTRFECYSPRRAAFFRRTVHGLRSMWRRYRTVLAVTEVIVPFNVRL